jgi:hypothetical protein
MKKNYDFSKAVRNPYSNSRVASAQTTAALKIPINEDSSANREDIDLVKRSLEGIGKEYFKLITTYEPSGIVRERVFCYELYHQIRLNMGTDYALSLNGEIDKRGHVDFHPADQKNPDFVFHLPGTHEGNTLIVEVKGTLTRRKEIIQDFSTILLFVTKYQYQAGIFILYNHSLHELVEDLGQGLRELTSDPSASSVYILAISEAHASCEETSLSALYANSGN